MAAVTSCENTLYSEKQVPVALCESLFLQPFPVLNGFLAPFFILVLVNLPSTELSVLSLKKIPKNKGGNLRLIPVIGFGTLGIFSCNLSRNLLPHELKKKLSVASQQNTK